MRNRGRTDGAIAFYKIARSSTSDITIFLCVCLMFRSWGPLFILDSDSFWEKQRACRHREHIAPIHSCGCDDLQSAFSALGHHLSPGIVEKTHQFGGPPHGRYLMKQRLVQCCCQSTAYIFFRLMLKSKCVVCEM
jgi:hypothetical protein